MDAIELAATVFRDNPPMRIDGRDLTYFMVAATLLKKDPSQNERLRALLFLETELYPEGRRDGLVKGLTGAEPARRRVRRPGVTP